MLSYAITDPSLYPDLEVAFFKFKNLFKADFILFRDKISDDYANKASKFIKFKTRFTSKFIIHNDVKLALSLGSNGVHFSSNNLDGLKFAPSNLIKFASTHNISEVNKACELKADFITFSPIYNSPNKGKAVGLQALKDIIKISTVPVFALGGIITDKEIQEVELAGSAGFASIRYFAN